MHSLPHCHKLEINHMMIPKPKTAQVNPGLWRGDEDCPNTADKEVLESRRRIKLEATTLIHTSYFPTQQSHLSLSLQWLYICTIWMTSEFTRLIITTLLNNRVQLLVWTPFFPLKTNAILLIFFFKNLFSNILLPWALVAACRLSVDEGLNPGLLHQEWGVLTVGPQGNPPFNILLLV